MGAKIFIENITFNEGTSYAIGENDIVVLTGANNVGKSAALKNLFYQDPSIFKVIQVRKLQKKGTVEEFITFLESSAFVEVNGTYRLPNGHSFDNRSLPAYWDNHIENMSSAFFSMLTTDVRLSGVNPVETIDFLHQRAKNSLQRMYLSECLKKKLTNTLKKHLILI